MKMASIHIFILSFMLLTSLFLTGSFATTSGDYGSKEHVTEKPKLEEEKFLSNNIAIQGLVYCKSGSNKLIPLEGALTRITCEAADAYGFETRAFSFLSEATDAKGYFIATLSPLDVAEKQVLKECRVFLEASPLDNCSYASDINKGISGALLHSYRYLHDKNMNLYTVGPFIFTSLP